jgi:transcriptional regulator with XRE-family HTH domain
MAANGGNKPATHLGRQMKRDREAHGWSLRVFGAMIETHIGTLSQVENGHRPMNEALALKCDEVFPERRGWYLQYYEESKSWMPAAFKDWSEYEAKAEELVIWCPGIVDGTAQTERYAREVLSIYPSVTPDVLETRLKGRMQRQQRLLRNNGPSIVLLLDHVALYRGIGSAEIMSEQCGRLAAVAQLETVTLQVIPPVKIPLATALVALADRNAAYTENAISGSVYTDGETVGRLRALIGTVRGEAAKVSESLAMIREAQRRWTGASQRTARTADRRASK